MCWGSRDFIGGIGKEDCGYLTWVVSNNPKIRHKCFVTVALTGKDLYDVTVWHRTPYSLEKPSKVKIYGAVQDIFFDQLEDVIFSILG